MLRWRLLIFLLPFLFLVSADSPSDLLSPTQKSLARKVIKKVKRGEAAKLRDWDHHNRKVCSGTYNGRTLAGDDRIEDLRTMYENCTRVRGNLEITHLTMETMQNMNVSLTEKLKIFQHIEEIKGYLLIYNVDLELLWFPNLKIIWGDRLFDDHAGSKNGAALMISGNHQLKEIHMPKLRTIRHGDVLLENNTYLCYLESKVNWDELLNLEKGRLKADADAFRDCKHYVDSTACHPTCTSGHCWGRSATLCQHMYRTPCPDQCGITNTYGERSAPQCYFNETEKAYKCCHSACEGGCTGALDTDCVACKNFKLENACVSRCPERMVLGKNNKLVPNPTGTYTDDRYCVKQCPANMLIQKDYCVRNCAEGSFHDVNKTTRMCEDCPKEGCPRTCEVTAPLTREILAGLDKCEIINGYLKITGPLMKSPDTRFTPADLFVLRTVRIVSEYVYMVTTTVSPGNMSFLENLEVIEGRALDTEKHALVISRNDNLRELGLKKLKKIKAGDVFIRENHALCFASTINWTSSIMPGTSAVNVASNTDEETCKRRKKVCDPECNQKEGCWGSGPKMCVKCASWKLNDTCVSRCPQEDYFEDEETHECKPCFEECLQCKGPKKFDCISCKNVAVWENNRLSCVKGCSNRYFEFKRQCFPCHESCYDHGCTGSGNNLGDGGCQMCRHALVDRGNKVIQCLYTEGPQHQVCEANNFTHHYVSSTKVEGVEFVHCSECDDSCVSCSSAGPGVEANGCVCKDYVVVLRDKRMCGSECGQFFYTAKARTDKATGLCRRCNDYCDHNAGCEGPTASDCHKCAYASIFRNETAECVGECPRDKPYLGHLGDQKICADEDIDRIAQRRRTVAIVGSLAFLLVVVILVLIVIYKCRRLGRKLEKVRNENLADIPEEISVSARPNLNKVLLISSSELHNKSIKLGSGAFGIVYAGYWFPKGTTGKKVPVAIKVVNAMGKVKGQEESAMLDEAAKMAQLRHNHLLRLIGICLRDDGVELVTPLRPLGNLLNFIKKHKENLLGKHLLLYCYQIASAMRFLAENKLVHRDLAARNVLVKKIDHVEVTDFGLSKFISYGEHEITIEEGKIPIKWVPPEVWETYTYTSQSDVWSYGITCWEILTFGQSPYQGMTMSAIKSYLLDQGLRLPQPNHCSLPLYQIVLQCWLVNPDARPSFPVLYDRFKEFCKTPNAYVLESTNCVSFNEEDLDQEKELQELMDEEFDWGDVENPLHYFDNQGQDTDSLMGQPLGRAGRRLTSTSSQRYHTDPLARTNALQHSMSVGIEDNYLVPDSKLSEQQAILYTPVVVNENGGTELLEMDYYNDQKPGPSKEHNYYNQPLKHQDSVLRKIQEESEEVEKESCV